MYTNWIRSSIAISMHTSGIDTEHLNHEFHMAPVLIQIV